MATYSILFTLIVTFARFAASKEPPTISEDFSCFTQEIGSDNTTVVRQVLNFDSTRRRSNMEAVGSLVKGAMQQIKRCDLFPQEGWMTSSGGPDPKEPGDWQCTNTTITPAGELPQFCQYGTFWNFPSMRYIGTETMNGVDSDRWEYISGGEKYAFWAEIDAAVPVATGKVSSPNPSSLWTIYFTDFTPVAPDEGAYTSIPGVVCPAATPAPSELPSSSSSSSSPSSPSFLNLVRSQPPPVLSASTDFW